MANNDQAPIWEYTPGKPIRSASALIEAHMAGDFILARRIWEQMHEEYDSPETSRIVESVSISESCDHQTGYDLFANILLRLGHARRNS